MNRRSFIKKMGWSVFGAGLLMQSGWMWKQIAWAEEFPKPSKKDRCPVCGMFVARYPKWNAGMKFKDGNVVFFCSPKCFLHTYHHLSKYIPGKTRNDIAVMWVTDYYTTKKIKANDPDTYFVAGTTLVGPMGWDVVPVKGREAAEILKKDYGGTAVLHLDEVTEEQIERARRGMRK